MIDKIAILLTIILPFAISFLLVICFLGRGSWGVARLVSVFKLDTSRGLFYQGLLWLAILIPVCTALSLGLWVWPAHDVDMSAAGYKYFIEISILPLAVMSLALPLAGLISRFHSTQQTAKQIEVVSFKNNIDAFYTHRKELVAYFAAMPNTNYLGVMDFSHGLHPVLHVRFFDGVPNEGWPRVNQSSFEHVGRHLSAGAKFLKHVLEPSAEGGISNLDSYLNACLSIYLAAQALHIREITMDLVLRGVSVKSKSLDQAGYDHLTIGTTTLEVLAAIRFTKNYYDNLCDFAGVPRIKFPSAFNVVFTGGERVLKGELVIESLHRTDIPELVAAGFARYDERHPSLVQREPLTGG